MKVPADALSMQGYRVYLELQGKIHGKARARYSPRSGRWYTPRESADYQARVEEALKQAIAKQIIAQGYRASLHRGQRVEVGTLCIFGSLKHPDTDNVMKLVWDAVSNVLGINDNTFAGGVDYHYTDTTERLIVSVRF
jgi:Holliday junction resolvase RusA-like endonuclease